MRARSDDVERGEGRDRGWDETVLVWNATVARITRPATKPESSETANASQAREPGRCDGPARDRPVARRTSDR